MTVSLSHAPGVPPDYYERIVAVEEGHWWYRGMRAISAALLGDRLARPGLALLDAGCGAGGYLRWAVDRSAPARVAGVDIGSEAIELARAHVPEAELCVAPLHHLPFDDESFDVVVSNDVLQHVPEDEVGPSLRELRRVLVPGGTLLVRTNGSRRLRRERADWRAYDARSLVAALEAAGLDGVRVTHANMLLSVAGALRRRVPHAPSSTSAGVPGSEPSRLVQAIGGRLLDLEARWLGRPRRSLPYGHTLFAICTRA